jgi:hypothetical protein
MRWQTQNKVASDMFSEVNLSVRCI